MDPSGALSDPVAVTTVADMVKVESQVRYLCQTLGYKRVNDLRSHNRPKSGTVDWFDNYPLISRYAPVDYQAADTALYINSKFATNRKVTS